jgi:hypothetical protein
VTGGACEQSYQRLTVVGEARRTWQKRGSEIILISFL